MNSPHLGAASRGTEFHSKSAEFQELSDQEVYSALQATLSGPVRKSGMRALRVTFEVQGCIARLTRYSRGTQCKSSNPYFGNGVQFDLRHLMTNPTLVEKHERETWQALSWNFQPHVRAKLQQQQHAIWLVVSKFYDENAPLASRTTEKTQRIFAGEFGVEVGTNHNFHLRCDGQDEVFELIGEKVTFSVPKAKQKKVAGLLSEYAARKCQPN